MLCQLQKGIFMVRQGQNHQRINLIKHENISIYLVRKINHKSHPIYPIPLLLYGSTFDNLHYLEKIF